MLQLCYATLRFYARRQTLEKIIIVVGIVSYGVVRIIWIDSMKNTALLVVVVPPIEI